MGEDRGRIPLDFSFLKSSLRNCMEEFYCDFTVLAMSTRSFKKLFEFMTFSFILLFSLLSLCLWHMKHV